MSERKARALRKLFDAPTRTDNPAPHTVIKLGERKVIDEHGNVTQVQDVCRNFASARTNHYRRAKRTARGVPVLTLPQHYRANLQQAAMDEHMMRQYAEMQPKGFFGKIKAKIQTTLLTRRLKAEHRQALRTSKRHSVRYI